MDNLSFFNYKKNMFLEKEFQKEIVDFDFIYSNHSKSGKIILEEININNYYNDISSLIGYCIFNENNFFILNKKEKILIFKGNKLDGLFYYLDNFLKLSQLDYDSIYNIIKYSKNTLQLTDLELNRVFHKLNWALSEKGFEFYETYKDFNDSLKELIKQKKIGLNEAFYFHITFNNNKEIYPAILKILNGTYSENNKIMKLLTEIYKKYEDKTIIEKILNISFTNNAEKTIENLEAIFYEKYQKIKNIFIDFLNKLDINKYAIINYNKYFETNIYEIVVKFKSIEELITKLEKILNKLEKAKKTDNFKDYFDLKELFSNIE